MIWKQIPGYEWKYWVSNTGLIKNKDRVLKLDFSNRYARVDMYENNKRIKVCVHKTVMQEFFGKCPEGLQINHKNGDRKDNSINNLEYVTPSENIKHSFALGMSKGPRSEKCWKVKLNKDLVIEIREKYATGKYLQKELAVIYGVTAGAIGPIIRKQNWKNI